MPSAPAASCASTALAIYGGRKDGDFFGVALGTVVVTNIGPATCQLSGTPTLALTDDEGPLDLPQADTPGLAISPVVLAPNGSATLTVDWVNWCHPAPGPLQITIGLPDGAGTVIGPFNGPPGGTFVPACQSATQPSAVGVVQGYAPG